MSSLKIDLHKLLPDMYSDSYYPDFLVDKVRDLLIQVAVRIEKENPQSLEELYAITCWATEQINGHQDEFSDNDSEIETVAREDIATSFQYVAHTYGFLNADIEELVDTRDW